MWLHCRTIPTALLCFRTEDGSGGGQQLDGKTSEVFDKNICGFDNLSSATPHPHHPPTATDAHPFLVQISQTLACPWGGIWPQYADTSISFGEKFHTQQRRCSYCQLSGCFFAAASSFFHGICERQTLQTTSNLWCDCSHIKRGRRSRPGLCPKKTLLFVCCFSEGNLSVCCCFSAHT